MNEHETRPDDTPLTEALRRYAKGMYKLGNEGESSYETRLLHATFVVDDILEHFVKHSSVAALQLRDELMPGARDKPRFQEAFTLMRLAPLRLMARDHIPLEDLTPRAIEIGFNVAVKIGADQHAECIDGSDDDACEQQHVCPMKMSRRLGFQLLEMLTIQERFADTISGETRQIVGNIEAVKLSMQRLSLAPEPEIEKEVTEYRQDYRTLYDQLIDPYPEENRDIES